MGDNNKNKQDIIEGTLELTPISALFEAIGRGDLEAVKAIYNTNKKNGVDVFSQIHNAMSPLDKALYAHKTVEGADNKKTAASIIEFIKEHGGRQAIDIEHERLRAMQPSADESIKEFVQRNASDLLLDSRTPTSDALTKNSHLVKPFTQETTVLKPEQNSSIQQASFITPDGNGEVTVITFERAYAEKEGGPETFYHSDRIVSDVVAVVRQGLSGENKTDRIFGIKENLDFISPMQTMFSVGDAKMHDVSRAILRLPATMNGDIIFTRSLNSEEHDKVNREQQYINGEHQASFDAGETLLEMLKPVVFNGVGNARKIGDRYQDLHPIMHGPRSMMIGAVTRKQGQWQLEDYSESHPLLTAPMVTRSNGKALSGTSFAGPYAAAVYAELKEAAYARNPDSAPTPEELFYIMAASADRYDILEEGKQGVLTFHPNRGGLAFNTIAGAGVVNPHDANTLAQKLEEIKQETGKTSEYKNIEQPISVGEFKRDGSDYVYQVTLPEGIIASHFLGDFRFTNKQKGKVAIISPSGTKTNVRMATNEKTSVYAFMGETFEQGQVIEIRTDKPLEAGSDINIRGVNTDSPLADLREYAIEFQQQKAKEAERIAAERAKEAAKYAPAVEALNKLSSQGYVGNSIDDKRIDQNDTKVQMGINLNWGDPGKKQQVANVHKQVREALDIDKDGKVALEEVQKAAQRAGITIDNEADLVQLLNTPSTPQQGRNTQNR